MIETVGNCTRRIFGMLPSERLNRQFKSPELVLVAAAATILDDAAINWLTENPGTLLADSQGRSLAVAVEPARVVAARGAIEGGGRGERFPVATTKELGERFVRKLRRRSQMLAMSLDDVTSPKAERLLFANVYKGITDVVTKWAWPVPAFVVTKIAARLGIPPNAITIVGIALTIIATWLFYIGNISGALIAAWTMTFLDTVDGKLARVTVTSSRLGNALDHGTDIVHPPLWWLALANGLAIVAPAQSQSIWQACWVILATYLLGRIIERVFRKSFGFNAFLFARFDSRFRLIVARRNILLLIMSVGLLAGELVAAFWACAIWSIFSTILQAVRLGQAKLASRDQSLTPWIA